MEMASAGIGADLRSGLLAPWGSVTVPRSALTPLDPFDRGGEGSLYRIGRSSPGGTALLFKEYHPERLGELRPEPLSKVVGFARTIDPVTLDWLYQHAAWPSWVVEDGGRPVGVVLPMAAPRFMVSVRRSSGGKRVVPAKMELLLNGDPFLASVGIAISPRQKLQLLCSTAESLSFFHAHTMFIGDFSCKNLLFALTPGPAAYFIDCDSISWQGESVLPAGETPEWELPPGQQLGSAPADVYKFALLVLRIHSGAQHHRSIARLPPGVSPDIRTLLERSLSTSISDRPLISEWIGPLQTAIAAASDLAPVPVIPPVPIRSVQRWDRVWVAAQGAQSRRSPAAAPQRPVPNGSPPGDPPQTLLPPGRVNDALMNAARWLLIRRPAAPTGAKLFAMLVGLWAACGLVLGLAILAGVNLRRLNGGTEVILGLALIALAGFAIFLTTTEPG